MLNTKRAIVIVCCFVMFAGYGAVIAQTGRPNAEGDLLLRQVLADLNLVRKKVERLDEQVAKLERRIEQLEVGGTPGSQAAGRPSTVMGRVMRVEGVETRTGDDEALNKASQLRTEAEDLEAKARKKDEEVAANRAQKVPWHYDLARRRTWEYEQKQARKSLREIARKYREEAKKKTGEAIRLEKKAKEPRQVIRGWNGRGTVTLQTVRDLSRRLRDLTPESCLKWTGTITQSGEDSETWSVTMVELVDCPPGLNNATRPDRKP